VTSQDMAMVPFLGLLALFRGMSGTTSQVRCLADMGLMHCTPGPLVMLPMMRYRPNDAELGGGPGCLARHLTSKP
jgi:hypothetical protein